MPKPEPALLDPARYPFNCTIQTRFSDLDTNLHINNAALTGILEDAHVRYHRASGWHGTMGEGMSPPSNRGGPATRLPNWWTASSPMHSWRWSA